MVELRRCACCAPSTFFTSARQGGDEQQGMVDLHPGGPVVVGPLIALLRSHVQVQCCFTSTEAVGLLGTGAQDDHLDFHTAPELCALPYAWTYIYIYIYICPCPYVPVIYPEGMLWPSCC